VKLVQLGGERDVVVVVVMGLLMDTRARHVVGHLACLDSDGQAVAASSNSLYCVTSDR
jgi:hypothetical protein